MYNMERLPQESTASSEGKRQDRLESFGQLSQRNGIWVETLFWVFCFVLFCSCVGGAACSRYGSQRMNCPREFSASITWISGWNIGCQAQWPSFIVFACLFLNYNYFTFYVCSIHLFHGSSCRYATLEGVCCLIPSCVFQGLT